MVVQRLTVGRGVDGLDVIGFDVVLHGELPARSDLAEFERRDRLDFVEIDPVEAADQRCGIFFEWRCFSVEIDKNPIVPRGHPHGLEAVVGWIEPIRLVPVGAAETR